MNFSVTWGTGTILISVPLWVATCHCILSTSQELIFQFNFFLILLMTMGWYWGDFIWVKSLPAHVSYWTDLLCSVCLSCAPGDLSSASREHRQSPSWFGYLDLVAQEPAALYKWGSKHFILSQLKAYGQQLSSSLESQPPKEPRCW